MTELKTQNDARFKPGGRLFLPELLDFIEDEAESHEERVDAIRQYVKKDPSHRQLLQRFVHAIYNPDVKMELPETDPPYRESDSPDYTFAGRNLFKVARQIERFMKDKSDFIEQSTKREKVFITFLEGLHPKEAKLLLAMKDKDISRFYSKFGPALVKEADPDVLPDSIYSLDQGKSESEQKSTSTQKKSSGSTSKKSGSKSQGGSSTTSKSKAKSGTRSTTSRSRKNTSGKSSAQSGQASGNTKNDSSGPAQYADASDDGGDE